MARYTHGFVRKVSRSLGQCELTHLARVSIDPGRAASQHEQYTALLRQAGVTLTILPEEPTLPDATFVEDTVVMLDELAVLCRSGAGSRRPEIDAINPVVSAVRPVRRVMSPGTLDGGDVLLVDRTLYVGRSRRTNDEGIRQLEQAVQACGYRVVPMSMNDCLHLKSAATSPADGLLIANPDWIDCSLFHGLEILAVPKEEPWGANTLSVNDAVILPACFPRTAELLASRGLEVKPVDVSELQKAEAGVTCLSVLFCAGSSQDSRS